MGRRGPSPKGEFSGQSAVLSTRIRPDTRAHLERAAEANGRSLSQEIEFRLRRTFIEDEKMSDAFGSRQNYLLMRLISLALESSINIDDPFANWKNDPTKFDQAVKAANAVLEALRPAAREPNSDPLLEAVYQHRSFEQAAVLWNKVQNSDPALPLSEGSKSRHFLGIVQAELGDLAARPLVLQGNAEQLTKQVEDIKSKGKSGRKK